MYVRNASLSIFHTHPSFQLPTTLMFMEPQDNDFTSTVDTSRPFSSVKEAVAIFGERLLVGEIYSPSPKPFSETTAYSPSPPIRRERSWRFSSSPSPIKSSKAEESSTLLDTVKKLETELEKTKVELKLLKERGSETEVALATLNAELHKNMSKLAQAEATAAGKAAVATKTVRFEEIERCENGEDEEEKKRDGMRRMGDTKTVAPQIMSLGEKDHIFGGKKVRKKQKPIIPLVGDLLFFKRKTTASTNHHNPLYASPF